jgi:hypothetical protein
LKKYSAKTLMQFLVASIAISFSCYSYASENKCTVGKTLLDAARKSVPSDGPMEPLTRSFKYIAPEKDELRYASISIAEQDTFVKGSKYAAIVEVALGQAWVYKYAGYDGSHSWFGPFQISTEQLASCENAKAPYIIQMLNRR